MVKYSFPHVNISTIDGSTVAGAAVSGSLLCHVPFFFIHAEMGSEGVPVLCSNLSDAEAAFGVNTFNENSEFYTHQTKYAVDALGYQPIYLIRVTDGTTTDASLVLLLTLTTTSLTQYQVDALGERVLDASGNPVPQTEADGKTPLTQPGYIGTWSSRALASNETFDGLTTVTKVNSDSSTSVTYPIVSMIASSSGSGPNRAGIKFYASSDVSTTVEENIKSALYRFAPVQLAADNSGNVNAVQDIYVQNYNDVSLKSSAVDPTTAEDMSLNGIMTTNYTDTDGDSLVPYQVHVYSANVSTIGRAIMSVSTELGTIDPFAINLVSALDNNGNPYEHYEVDAASSSVVDENVVLYLSGGTDGDVSAAGFETQVASYVQSDEVDQISDVFRYPLTNFYDSGFTLATKDALVLLFGVRDDIKIDMATQDISLAWNTQAQDQSTGAALLAKLRAYPESSDQGTGGCRGTIYMQCGYLTTTDGYVGTVPLTYWRMIRRCQDLSGTYVKDTPKGRPNSEVTMFRKLNWTASTDAARQVAWDNCLNAARYADSDTLFVPDLRSDYGIESSLLSDDVFTDYLVIVKHIVRNRWTYYAGVELPFAKLKTTVEHALNVDFSDVFRTYVDATATLSQTDADLKNGSSYTVTVSFQGDMPNRIWNTYINVSRRTSTVSSS